MSESPKHKTVAILFADIVGYTILMQNKEEQALLQLQNFKHRFQYSRHLQSLFELPEFQELINPIWPTDNVGEVIIKEVTQYFDTPDTAENITTAFKSNQKIQLKAHNHFVKFKLGMANNYAKQKINYQYQLANLDREWNTAKKGEITLNNLPFGQ